MISVSLSIIQTVRFEHGKLAASVKKYGSRYESTSGNAAQSFILHGNYNDLKLASRRNRKQRLKSPSR